MKRSLTTLLILILLAAPAEASFKSKMKHVGHVVKKTALYTAVGIAVIAICAKGGCEF
jgi:hypothetical protein